MTLKDRIEALVAQGADAPRDQARTLVKELRDALSAGEIRAAEEDVSSPAGWRVNTWVKQGILLAFRFGNVVDRPPTAVAFFRQRHAAVEAHESVERRPYRSRRIECAGRRLPGTRCHLHAADVHQHRRVGG